MHVYWQYLFYYIKMKQNATQMKNYSPNSKEDGNHVDID